MDTRAVLEGWNFLGGLDWAGVDIVAELIGVRDPETWLYGLTVVRDHFNKKERDAIQPRP